MLGYVFISAGEESHYKAHSIIILVQKTNYRNHGKQKSRELIHFSFIIRNCYFGKWLAESDETPELYLRRLHRLFHEGTQGLLLHVDEQLFHDVSPGELYSLWMGL